MSDNGRDDADSAKRRRRFDVRSEAGAHSGHQTVAEAWAIGRLRQAKILLERFSTEFGDHEPQDPNLLRDYYLWTGNPHYRTDFGWSAGHPDNSEEDPADVIERVNC